MSLTLDLRMYRNITTYTTIPRELCMSSFLRNRKLIMNLLLFYIPHNSPPFQVLLLFLTESSSEAHEKSTCFIHTYWDRRVIIVFVDERKDKPLNYHFELLGISICK